MENIIEPVVTRTNTFATTVVLDQEGKPCGFIYEDGDDNDTLSF